jgi:hypothetical protein
VDYIFQEINTAGMYDLQAKLAGSKEIIIENTVFFILIG